jgi:hypothetical protein
MAAFPTTPVAASVGGLRSFATALGHPVYWAGPLRQHRYELRLTKEGRTFVRYLPPAARVGDRRAAYRTVATYPVARAVTALKRAAATRGVGADTTDGGFAFYDPAKPTSVYYARADTPGYEVEVFDPKPGRARALVLAGGLERVH